MDDHPGKLLDELESILGPEGLLVDPANLRKYGCDETEDLVFEPLAALLPSTVAQVASILSLASQRGVPVTPRGAGTGLSGGALPVCGGWVLSLERLNRIRRLDTDNLLVEAEAGVVTGELQSHVEASGLFYPPDPASRDTCLLGGNIAENAAGPRSCKYGSTRRWVLGLEAVLPDGRTLTTGSDVRKDVAGYDLTRLLIGSEGTLAVVTAATLRLVPTPGARLLLAVPCDSVEAAAEAVGLVFRLGFDPAACEFLEHRALELVERIASVPQALLAGEAALIIELDGPDTDQLVARATDLGAALAQQIKGDMLVAVDAAEQRRLWAVRQQVGPAVKEHCAYKEADTVVPRSALAQLIRTAHAIAADSGLEAVCYGHAGDGNIHVNLLRGALSHEAWVQGRNAAERRLFELVAELGGSVTGEHGIGWSQRDFLPLVRPAAGIEIMQSIKRAFDPAGILNPGKIFP